MSLRDHRNKLPANRKSKLPQPSSSYRSTTTLRPRRLLKSSHVLKRCNSDPLLGNSLCNDNPRNEDHRSLASTSELVNFRRQTCADIFCPLDNLLIQSPPRFEVTFFNI